MQNNSYSLRLRKAKLSDIRDIMLIEESAFHDFVWEKEELFMDRIDTFPEGFLLGELNGRNIGYICSEIWERQNQICRSYFNVGHSIKKQHDSKGKELYISSMGILPEYHGKGLGKALFEKFLVHIVNEFKYIESIILLVSENWKNARKIYSANGFREIDVLENFFSYKKNESYCENGIVMRKELLQNSQNIL